MSRFLDSGGTIELHTDLVRDFPYNADIAFRRAAMPAIHEIATLTSKGQITLPKAVVWQKIRALRRLSKTG